MTFNMEDTIKSCELSAFLSNYSLMRAGKIKAALERPMRLYNRRKTRIEHAYDLYNRGYRRNNLGIVGPTGSIFLEKDVTKSLCEFIEFLTNVNGD